MAKVIGLQFPVFALLIFGILYYPSINSWLPRYGLAKFFTSPQMFFLLSSLFIIWIRKLALREIGITKINFFSQIRLGIFLGLAPALLVFVLSTILTAFDHFYPFLPRPIFGGPPLNTEVTFSYLSTLLFLAPLSEELFFRGILFKALQEDYSPILCVLFSSLIFMAGHGHMMVGPLVLGLINAIVTFRSKSIAAPILFHSIANSYALILIIWFPNLYRYLSFLYE